MARAKKIDSVTSLWGDGDAKPEAPQMYSPEWQDYILGQLDDGDTDKEGNPTNYALRNLVMRNLGTIIHSVSRTVFDANEKNGWRATANHEMQVRWNGDKGDVRTFGETADVYPGTSDVFVARHAAATAATRAESRTYRKALNLNRTISAEEATSVPVTESGLEQYVSMGQLDAIDTICRRLNINVLKYINCQETKYEKPGMIPWAQAQTLLEKLGILQRKTKDALQAIKDIQGFGGYEANWSKV